MANVLGPVKWSESDDKEGYRTYKVTYKVEVTLGEGPAAARAATGLPAPGDQYSVGSDTDPFVWCQQESSTTQMVEGEPCEFFLVEKTFSNKPPDNKQQRCNQTQTQDPLLEPQKLSGGGCKYTKEAAFDRFGRAVRNSAWEVIRGAQVEFDENRGIINVEQNVAVLNLALCEAMRDHVNQFPLWGLPPRCIKLSDFNWERKYYGQCYVYWTRKFKFDCRKESFDKTLLDEGSKVLNGHWETTTVGTKKVKTGVWALDPIEGYTPPAGQSNPNPLVPAHFIRATDFAGNPCKITLDGAGRPVVPSDRDILFTCSTCSTGGAPKFWRISGWDSNLVLQHVSGCVWSGQDELVPVNTFTLQLDSQNLAWVLTNDTDGSAWFSPEGQFFCNEPNQLSPDNSTFLDGIGPLVMSPGSQPGSIYIQRYEEADFTLLGIPIDLEAPL